MGKTKGLCHISNMYFDMYFAELTALFPRHLTACAFGCGRRIYNDINDDINNDIDRTAYGFRHINDSCVPKWIKGVTVPLLHVKKIIMKYAGNFSLQLKPLGL